MHLDANPWNQSSTIAAEAPADARAAFLVKTYVHLALAIFAFVAIEAVLFLSGVAEMLRPFMMGRLSWGIVLVAFIGVSWIADQWARRTTSVPMQYAGLALYVVAEAVIFVPLLSVALLYGQEKAIMNAGIVTFVMFAALTGVVFITRKDFSFLRGALMIGAIGSMVVIVAALIFNFNLGVIFSGAMIVLACGFILFNTSNVLHHYRTDQHVSAALALFADVALLFWYVLRIFLSRR
jgi:FtsH-binding integral membrane protein